jgi:hypothetical protein
MERQPSNRRWGVYRRKSEIDIAPCDARGIIASGHALGAFCGCKPRVEKERYEVSVVIHNNHKFTEPPDGNS